MPHDRSSFGIGFQTTHWSLVARAGGGDAQAQREALSELVRRYAPALRAHLCYAKRLRPETAEDLVQGFLADKVLEHHLIEKADRQRGRFRAFLVVALERFATNQLRYQSAAKRSSGPQAGLDQADEMAGATPPAGDSFDMAWARQVLERTTHEMRTQCESGGRADIWGVFEGRVLRPCLEQAAPVPYDELVRQYGFASPSQASNALVTAQRTFARILRSVLGEYAMGDDEIDAELADLREILSRGPSA